MPTAPHKLNTKWIGWVLVGSMAAAACNGVLACAAAAVCEYLGSPPGPVFFGMSYDKVLYTQVLLGGVLAYGGAATYAVHAMWSERRRDSTSSHANEKSTSTAPIVQQSRVDAGSGELAIGASCHGK
jgi:hypothetical protein